MSHGSHTSSASRLLRVYLRVFAGLLCAADASAQQVDIAGPPGSVAFGTAVAALPNGNIVITDPFFSGPAAEAGAVYLYSPTGALISSLTGTAINDRVGIGGISVLANGNFVISSANWDNGIVADAGAITWVNGSTGLSGAVSALNSLVGTQASDHVGKFGVTVLGNGNYVVSSPYWNNGTIENVGAVTWARGSTGLTGSVSDANSLVGTVAYDLVGYGVTALSNGNYVVRSSYWGGVGAVTWANGSTGLTGQVSFANSLVGTTAGDHLGAGGVTALSNGNYVVSSPEWSNGASVHVGATTWVNGSMAFSGEVSAANSLIGTTTEDKVGAGVTALGNGNYVVTSPDWDNGAAMDVGAATWVNGSTGLVGAISIANSLIGTTANDKVGSGGDVDYSGGNVGYGYKGVTALSNGNYVVASPYWDNGASFNAGAATWANGSLGLSGTVSTANSLVGTTADDFVSSYGVIALSRSNYVVSSPSWTNGAASGTGAVTWANGNIGLSGSVSVVNSLVGTAAGDQVGLGIKALSNGNYVVASHNWDNGPTTWAGAVTWADGSTGLFGPVSAANSLVGTTAFEHVGHRVTALSNGNFVVGTPYWDNGAAEDAGAVTWVNGSRGVVGAISTANSLVGTTAYDYLGSGVTALVNGNYAAMSIYWHNGATAYAGVVSLGRGSSSLVGPVAETNSVRGNVANGGQRMVFAYDAAGDQLVVGQPASNIVSLFKADQLFASRFD